MKRTASIILIVIMCLFALSSCADKTAVGSADSGDTKTTEKEETSAYADVTEKENAPEDSDSDSDNKEETAMKLKITVNGKSFFAELNDSAASRELVDMLPLTVDMTELNGNEKYYYLPDRLTKDDKNVGAIEAGDIMLYSGNCLVLFYDSFSTIYSYTYLGKITDSTGLKEALGKGNATVSFELAG